MTNTAPSLRIGTTTLDTASGTLHADTGEPIPLRPQSMQVLLTLAARPGEVMSKDEILGAVWPDVAVTDDSLVQCIADIRRAVGPANRPLIQTVPKFGYRMAQNTVEPSVRAVATLEQEPIRYASARDGIKLAWTASGSGAPLLKAPSWITNIEMEARSLIFAPLYRDLEPLCRIVRFDQRGTSLSDRVAGPLAVEDMVDDIRAVADAAGLERFFLFGPSQGVAFSIAFAARYPDRVLGIIGRGGFAQGWLSTGDPVESKKYHASKSLIEAGWTAENPEYRRFFTARLIPDATPEIAREFDEMQRRAVDTAAMLANLELMCRLDVTQDVAEVRCPVLLVHSRGDRAVALSEGIRLAELLPNADLAILDDDNHIFLSGTLGFRQATTAMKAFIRSNIAGGT